jgi:prolyl-tRNA synthetase
MENAITPTREEDYPEWYQQVVKASDLAENAEVRGCMVIKPWGYGIWERIQRELDDMIKTLGHENAYFPLFIPLSFLEKEAKHVEGFAKECAVVTHHRLEEKGGKLIPTGELQEPLIIRPTSETIIGDSFSRWVSSYRDLPLLINQWCNVVRWEMRPRIFLRTTEFLWQEGHTVHASAEEAIAETMQMLEVYRTFHEEILAIPVVPGKKSPGETFPGAEATYTLEAMMQDRKALQGCTSHYLGQHFAKASNITFNNKEGKQEYGYTTSWGSTTRMIGSLIMVHGDDDGVRLPPRIAPKQIVIIPVIPKPEEEQRVLEYAKDLQRKLEKINYHGSNVRVVLDKRDRRGGEKNWEWIKKGIPLRIEVGPKDIEKGQVVLSRRDKGSKEKEFLTAEALLTRLPTILEEIQEAYFKKALEHLNSNTFDHLKSFEELQAFFTPKNKDRPEIHGGFAKVKWCGDEKTEELLKAHNLTIRCLPLAQSGTTGTCILTGKPATLDAIIAKSY